MLGPGAEAKVVSDGLVFEANAGVGEPLFSSSSPANGIAALQGVLTEPPELMLPGLDRESTNAGVPSLDSTGSARTVIGLLVGEPPRLECFECDLLGFLDPSALGLLWSLRLDAVSVPLPLSSPVGSSRWASSLPPDATDRTTSAKGARSRGRPRAAASPLGPHTVLLLRTLTGREAEAAGASTTGSSGKSYIDSSLSLPLAPPRSLEIPLSSPNANERALLWAIGSFRLVTED